MKEYDNLMDKVKNKATDIRDKMMDWLGFVRNDDGTWKLKEGLTNFEKILDVVKAIGVAVGTWKIASTVTKLLNNLGILNETQSFQWAFGMTLLLTGIFAQYKGTKHLLEGNIDLFTILETVLGTTGGALGIVSILKATKFGNALSLQNKLKIGFGVMLAIQGFQVLTDGIKTGDIKKTIAGALESTLSIGMTLHGIFGNKLVTGIKKVIANISTFGIMTVSSFKNARASGLNLGESFVTAGKDATGFIGKTGGVIAGLAGITAGSALSFATMRDFTTGTIGTTEAVVKLTAGLGAATASGVLAGSQFGTVGMIIGGVAGLTTSAVTAFMGYKDGIESLNIPTTTLTDEINSLTEEIDNNRKAHEQNVKSIKDTYENQLVEAEYANKLSKQLNGLVDANGKVKAGNEDRVKFVLGELNNALGTEYKLNGNLITKNGEVVNSYKELQSSIRNTIEAKKKEAEQTANVELYKESIKEQIQLERDKAKLQEKYAKAEIEYNNLMTKYDAGKISRWTLEHDEACVEIITNFTNVANKLNETRDKYWETTEDVSYYSQKMTDDIVENTGKLSKEMVTQAQVSSGKLQEMATNNQKTWEDTYNKLNTTQQSAMLAQSTTLDNWSPIIEEKWRNMANNSSKDFLNGIASVDTKTQQKILATVTTTENLTPDMVTAWGNLANKSFVDFSLALSRVQPDLQDKIIASITTTEGLTPTMQQAWSALASTSKDRFNQILSSLPEDTRGKIVASVMAVTDMTESTRSAYENLSETGKNAFNNAMSSMDTDARNKVQSAINAINSQSGNSYNAGWSIGNSADRGASDGTGDSWRKGRDFATGFSNGILGAIGLVQQSARKMVNSALENVAQAQLSHSPSKKTRKLGIDNGTGFALGIKDMIPEAVKNAKDLAVSAVGSLKNNLSTEGIVINPNDFKIDTNQFIDYGQISGAIATQSNVNVSSDIEGRIENAIYRGLSNATIPVEIEATTDEGVIFTKVQEKAREFTIQTGEPAFDY